METVFVPQRSAMASEERPPKRRRLAKSCEQCRSRKVRCDRNVPCGPCTRARSSLACSYRDGSPSPSTAGVNIFTPESAHHPAAEGFNETAPNYSTLAPVGESNIRAKSGSPLGEIRDQLRSLEDRLTKLPVNSHVPGDNGRLEEASHQLMERIQRIEERLTAPTQSVQRGDNENLTIAGIPPRLNATSKLLGTTHWIHKVDKLQVADSLSAKESEPSFRDQKADLMNSVKECRVIRELIKSREAVKLDDPVPDLRSTLPLKPVCDQMVQGYLRTFEPIYRVIHVPSFWKDYDEFWENRSPSPTPFLIKLVLILTIGSVFYPEPGDELKRQFTHLRQKWVYAAQWWLVGPSEKSSGNFDGLQVFCLLLLSRKIGGLGSSNWLSTNSLIEMAMRLGLHFDPVSFPSLSSFQAEMRLRIWATVVELSLQSSLESGLPFCLPLELDVRKPTNLDDRQISPDMNTVPPPKPSDQWTDASIQLSLQHSVQLRIEVLRFVTSRGRKSYQRALDLGKEMRLACRKMATFFQSSSAPESAQAIRPSTFHKKFLDMEMRRYILALHAPFMVQARKDPQFYYSRKASLESAMVVASYADSLMLPSSPLDDFSRLILCGRNAFKGPLGLEIISVLGLEIVTQLEEESSEQLLSDLVDKMAKANRAPIIQSLEHILEQLRQLIALGSPSLKRYNFLAAILRQIRAMESNQNVKQAVYEAIKDGLQECFELLRASIANSSDGTIPEIPTGIEVAERMVSGPFNPSPFQLNFDSTDSMFDLDLPSLLSFGGMNDLSDDYL